MSQSAAQSPHLLRHINRGELLRFALANGDFTAAEAMSATGLTRATVLGVCADLVGARWLEEIADSRAAGLSSRGRPARRYRLRPDAGVVLGIDAGESRFDAILADLRGQVLASEHRRADPAQLGRDGRVAVVRELVDATLDAANRHPTELLITVIGVPAPIDPEGRSPDDDGAFWQVMNADFQDHLEGLVVIENDANLAALAEHASHPGRNVATLLTGERFGAGLIVDGRLLHGSRGGAGELRFLEVFVRDDPDAGTEDGLGALARRWARGELDRTDAPSSLRALGADEIDAEAVFAAAAAGDALADGILRRLGSRLAHIVVVLESVLDVDEVVIAGGIAAGIGPVLGHARSTLEADFYPPFPELRASRLGREVIARGGIALALARIREDPLSILPVGVVA